MVCLARCAVSYSLHQPLARLTKAGWEMLHQRHGKLPWKKLFAPAIDIARNGFPVNKDLASFLVGKNFMLNDTNWAATYAPEGTLLKEGDTVYNEALACTLERLANEGPDIFYKDSSIADNIVKAAQDAGGILTHEDLAGYQAILRNASTISYRFV